MSTQAVADMAMPTLLRWIDQAGAQVSPKIHVVSLGGGERGLFAREEIADGTLLVRLPRQLLITVPQARSCELSRLIETHTQFEDPTLFLSAFLLQELEKGEASSWKPFLDVLPQSFPTHPFFYQEHELSLLKGSFILDLVALQYKNRQEDYAYLAEHVPGFKRFTFDMYLWAHLVVMTRVFGAKLNLVKTHCLAPLMDMLNDGIPWNCDWGWAADGEFFELKASSAIPQGKELRISYGTNSNTDLLRHYGFLHEHNPNNAVMVPLEFAKDDPLMDEKRQLLGLTAGSSTHCFSLPLKPDPQKIIELFSELRILHAEADELALVKEAADPLTRAKEPLSPRNEVQVIHSLAGACAARLAGYETSVEEDSRLLQDKNLSWNARNCILLRQGEKQILQVFAGVAG
jgi:histone-lysine N-methyltransferase SETD3